jgi:prepilin-type N-terminal cleavage/methylation domain-containing protein
MILRALKRIHKDQRGFTLIEVLVVMTILGILAAIVSISLLGVTASARSKAKLAEMKTVQAAFDAMLSDQQVPQSAIASVCDGTTNGNDMTKFPGPTSHGAPVATNTWSGPDSTLPTVLATHYLRETTTQYNYACTATGDVVQK